MAKFCYLFGPDNPPRRMMIEIYLKGEHIFRRHGVTQFVLGSHTRFDRVAMDALLCLADDMPDVTVGLIQSYDPLTHQTQLILGQEELDEVQQQLASAPRHTLREAELDMARRCDVMLCYAAEGTEALAIAKARNVPIYNLHDAELPLEPNSFDMDFLLN